MISNSDPALLSSIEDALAQAEHFPSMDASLKARYETAQDAGRRPYNRLAIGVSIVVFDLFLLTNMATVPSLVPLSATLRLGVATPLTRYSAPRSLSRRRSSARSCPAPS